MIRQHEWMFKVEWKCLEWRFLVWICRPKGAPSKRRQLKTYLATGKVKSGKSKDVSLQMVATGRRVIAL